MIKFILTSHTITYSDQTEIAKGMAKFINEEEIPRGSILSIVAGTSYQGIPYQTLYYYVEAVDVTIKEKPDHE